MKPFDPYPTPYPQRISMAASRRNCARPVDAACTLFMRWCFYSWFAAVFRPGNTGVSEDAPEFFHVSVACQRATPSPGISLSSVHATPSTDRQCEQASQVQYRQRDRMLGSCDIAVVDVLC